MPSDEVDNNFLIFTKLCRFVEMASVKDILDIAMGFQKTQVDESSKMHILFFGASGCLFSKTRLRDFSATLRNYLKG